jgi:hypothetical protein
MSALRGYSGAGGGAPAPPNPNPIYFARNVLAGSVGGTGWGIIEANVTVTLFLLKASRVAVWLSGNCYTDVATTTVFASFGALADPAFPIVDTPTVQTDVTSGGTVTGEREAGFAVNSVFDLSPGFHAIWGVANANGGSAIITNAQLLIMVGDAVPE